MAHASDLQNGHAGIIVVGSMEHPDYRFCPPCGGRARDAPAQDRRARPRLVCAACGFVFYMDPKVAVGTIIRTDDERLVLVRRAIEPGYGLWVFPGGYVDRGEEITAAALREAREESGLEVRIDGLINIYSYPGGAPIIIVYAATALGGELCGDDECLEARPVHAGADPVGRAGIPQHDRGAARLPRGSWHRPAAR